MDIEIGNQIFLLGDLKVRYSKVREAYVSWDVVIYRDEMGM